MSDQKKSWDDMSSKELVEVWEKEYPGQNHYCLQQAIDKARCREAGVKYTPPDPDDPLGEK